MHRDGVVTRAGFTLAEIMIAVVLLSLSLFFVISLLPTANMSLRKAEDTESVTLYGQQVVDNIRQNLPNSPSTWPASQTSVVTLNGTSFNVVQTVSTLNTQGSYTLYKVDVQMRRTDNRFAPIDMTTCLAVRTTP